MVARALAYVQNNPSNPDMLLFWLCNSLKLAASLTADATISQVFQEKAKGSLDATIDDALRFLVACAAAGQPLPAAITKSAAQRMLTLRGDAVSSARMRAVVTEHCKALDRSMNPDRCAIQLIRVLGSGARVLQCLIAILFAD